MSTKHNKLWYFILGVGWFLVFCCVFSPVFATATDLSEGELAAFRNYFAILDGGGPIDDVLDRSAWPNNDGLASYLELELLRHPRYDATLPRLLNFLERWPDHAQRKRVEKMVEVRLAESMQEKEALAWYDRNPPVATSARTYYAQLLLKRNRISEAQPLWKKLFLDGMVLPEDLKGKTTDFEKQLVTEEMEKRARSLIKNGSHQTLKAFIHNFPKNRRYYFLALDAATTGNEKLFSEYRAHLPKKEANKSELWYARFEWLRTHESFEKTYKMFKGPNGRHLNVNDRCALRYQLAKYLYNHDQLEEAYKLLNLNASEKGAELEDSLWLAAWTAHRLKHDKRALGLFELLGKKAKNGSLRAQGAWWAAELSKSKGAKKAWIDQAAKFPDTFYGLLAMETRDGRLPDLKKTSSKCDIIRDPRIQGDLQRMYWLRDLDRSYYNGPETENLARRYSLGTDDRVCLAVDSGAYGYAINLAQEKKKEEHFYWQGLYPIPHWKPGWGWQLDPALIWSMTRQESRFHIRSKSSSQAQGLLQIIPATAEEEARMSSLPPPDPTLIYDPSYNLALGQAYMRRMLSAFKGDLVLALCSYNAGPGRGEKWSERRRTEPALAFIENIPFDETRNYVKLVIKGVVYYRLLMYGKGSILKIVNEGEPGLAKLLINAANSTGLTLSRSLLQP